MAVKDFFDNLNGGARWDVGVSINRSNSLPLDANSVFASLEAAQNYAAGNPAEGTLANAYPGQVLAVVTDAETIIYYIDANMTLQPVGNTKDVMAYIGDIPEDSDAESIIEYIEAAVADKVEKVDGKGLSTNDLTDELKEQYDAAYTHAVSDHAPVGAQANIIEAIKVNGEEQTVTDKVVDITVPTKVSDLENDSEFITHTEAEEVVESVKTYAKLTIESTTDELDDNIAKRYTFKQNNSVIATIDLAKELVVTSGSVKTVAEAGKPYEGAVVGDKYIELVIANQETPIYVPAKDLVDIYTAEAEAEEIQIVISGTNEISATIVDGSVTEDKFAEDVKTKLNKDWGSVAQGLVDAVAERVDELEKIDHSHDNADVIDGITEEQVAAWDEAEKNVVASVDESQFAVDTDRKLTLLDIAQSKISGLKNAAGNDISLEDALAGKIDKNGTDRLITLDEAAKLELLVIDEETGQAAISGTVNANQVQGLSDLLDKRVEKVEGMGLSANNFTDTLLGKLNGIQEGAQVNVIEVIKFNGATVTVGEDKVADITYALPIADADTLGGVKSVDAIIGEDGKLTNASAIENKISVADDGTMEVNSLNVNKLVQTDGDTLILNGGSAQN